MTDEIIEMLCDNFILEELRSLACATFTKIGINGHETVLNTR